MTRPNPQNPQQSNPSSNDPARAPGVPNPGADAGCVSVGSSGNAGPSAGSGAVAGTGSVVDRRLGLDRRQIQAHLDGDDSSGLERRRGRGRRLSDFTKSAEEGEMTKEQFLFLMAIDQFKKSNAMAFPTWTDVLEVIRLLGYRKTMASELNLRNADDWREQPNTPSNVRPQRWSQRAEVDRRRAETDRGQSEAA